MMSKKPAVPKGTRDFLPFEMVRREYIFNTIKSVFEKYGYVPIETPAMENLSTLLGKYGNEGDKLLFKILNSGDYLKNVSEKLLTQKNQNNLTPEISNKGLRYDLTVPFARFVVQYQHETGFPFKRYQIQPVWRADKPQKGRYREFYQCDVDVIGSNALLNEVELIQIIDDVFTELGVNVTVKINNRKILTGVAEFIGEPEKFTRLTVIVDKLDKIGFDGVIDELQAAGFSDNAVEKLKKVLQLEGKLKEIFPALMDLLKDSETGREGIEETMTIMRHLKDIGLKSKFQLDLTLARGLNYYTGAIIEVVSNDVSIGSICGGGRYDDLTGIFGLQGVSGVGVSFGADRIYDVMHEMDIFPESLEAVTQVMFVNFGREEEKYCIPLAAKLRNAGISTEIFPDQAKMKKQMNYANRKNIPYVVLVGSKEMESGKLTIKFMESGEQKSMSIEEIIQTVKVLRKLTANG